jgi:two-component system cell cycle sensor histidine kinase/response regulator CckA
MVINHDGIIRYASPALERMTGFKVAEMSGRKALDLVHPDDLQQSRDALHRIMVTPAMPVTFEHRYRHADGSWRRMESVGRSITGEAEEGFIILNSRDITETTQLEEQLRQSQKMESVGQLAGGVAHDFNNLLTIIQGHVSLLQSEEALREDLLESVSEIRLASDRAANLTRQLLAFSRRQTMRIRPVDLNEAIAHTTKMLQRILGEDINIQINHTGQSAMVLADVGMIEQVLLNLAVNSRDAMPRGGQLVIETANLEIDASTAVRFPEGRPGTFVRLSVRDTGCGMPPEVLRRIFEPFFTTKEVGKGTGLGLATVYGIVQQHQGWIHVSSEVGQGTTFQVYLPGGPRSEVTTATVQDPKIAPSGTETILLVEDEPALLILMRNTLSRLGYRVIEASSGVKALEAWSVHKAEIQLLLTDMVVPDGITGGELARRLCTEKPDLRVLYTSGYSPEIAGRDFPLTEGVNFLAKPFNRIALAQTVRRSLDGALTGAVLSL